MEQLATSRINIRELKDFLFVADTTGQWAALSYEAGRASKAEYIESARHVLERNLVIETEKNSAARADAIRRWRSTNSDTPGLFIVHLTQRCNLTCGFCHSSAVGVEAQGKDITDETLRNVAKFIASSPGASKSIAFQGGEPTLCLDKIERFQGYLNSCLSADVRITYGLTTNGTLLTDQVLRQLDRLNVRLSLSVDGPANLHNIERRYEDGRGSYHDTTANRALLQQRFSHLFSGQIMVVTASTAPYFKDILDEYIEGGGRLLRFKMVTPLGRGKKFFKDSDQLSAEMVISYHKRVILYLKDIYKRTGVLVGELYIVTALRKLFDRVNVGDIDSRNICGIARNVVDFDISGQIHACHETSKYKYFLIGDASEKYSDVFESILAARMRSLTDLHRHEACQQCAYFNYCTPCPAKNYQESGDPEVRPHESIECIKTLSMMDFLLEELQTDPQYYHRLWQEQAIERALTALATPA